MAHEPAPVEQASDVLTVERLVAEPLLRGALIGQLAVAELASSPGAERTLRGIRRLGCTPSAQEFYSEHVEADAVHEQLVRRGVIAPLLAAEPELAADVVFGMQATNLLASRLSDLLLGCWADGRSSLRHALPEPAAYES